MTRPYSVIECDCPWQPRDKLPGKRRGAAKNYPTMSTEALMRYQLPPIADDAIMFFWRLASMQQDALDVVKAWDFTVSSEVVWRKLTKNGKEWFGMGRTVRGTHETALVCTRGKYSTLIRKRNVRSLFSAKVPVVGDDDPRLGQPYLDENDEPVERKDGTIRVYKAGDYIHSAKPPAFLTKVIYPMVGPPTEDGHFLELFSRKRRKNWTQIGNQLPPDDTQ